MEKVESPVAKVVPDDWIGVEADWSRRSSSPWPHLVSIDPHELSTHALLIGSTGSGKTNAIHHLVMQDLKRGHSVCVLDMRGDLVLAVLELAAGTVNPSLVKILDLRERNRPFGFDPLGGAGEAYFRSLSFLDAIRRISDSWGVQVEETGRNLTMALTEAGQPVTYAEAFLYDQDFRSFVLQAVSSETVRTFWKRYDSMSAERQSALASPVMNKLSGLLATTSLSRILSHPHPIDLKQQVDTPGSLTLVSLAVDEMHSLGRMFGSVFLACLCREVFSRVQSSERSRAGLRLYVDEFEHFTGPEFENILAEGRRFNFSVVLAHQTLAQLSPKMRSMILNNVGLKFVFRCGREDGSSLSKDIFGGPNDFDFCNLPVGHALLWRRGQRAQTVEINEPLIRVGELSSDARLFLADVYRYANGTSTGTFRRNYVKPKLESPPDCVNPKRSRPKAARPADLEEWLSE